MRKSLLFSAMVAIMLGSTVDVQAETAYGLMSGYPTWSVCSYDWAALGNVDAEKLFDVPFSDVQAATSVGDAYYAIGIISDNVTYVDNLVLASVNMETQETVIVKEYGDLYGENGFVVRDLASDGSTLYALVDDNIWNEETETLSYGSLLKKVNIEDGSLENVGRIEAVCWGLACKDGEMYVVTQNGMKGWSYLINLCKLNEDYTLTALTNNEDVTANEIAPSHAVATADGVCFFGGATPYLFDLTAGTITMLEDDVTRYQSYAGTTFTASTQSGNAGGSGSVDDEQPVTRLLVCTSSFGDFMGSAKEDKLTAQKLYFYNQNLQLVAVVDNAADLNSTMLYAQYYSPYIYDEDGNLSMIDRFQYGLYDFGDRAMHQAAGVVEYHYDALGNCIEEVESLNTTTYEYDADGNCIKEVHMSNGNVGKTLTYSDFTAGKNKPAIVVSTHTNDTFTGEFYEETREYDAQGRLIKTVRLCNRDYEENYGLWSITTAVGDFMQEEHWTYDGKQLMLYEKFNSQDEETGALLPYLKTVYTVKDENTVGYQSYTAFGDEWYKSGVYQENTYLEFAGMTDVTALQIVDVQKAETGVNDATIEFTVPMIANFNTNVAFDIYRNGELIRTVNLMDAFEEGTGLVINEENGSLIYTDYDVPSGRYDYFIQLMIVSGGENGGVEPLDDDDIDPDFNVEPLVYTGYCTSNIVNVDLTIWNLPEAANVRIVASEKGSNDENKVTIAYEMQEFDEALGFISNELIVNGSQLGEDVTKDPTVKELHCTLYEDTAVVFILTRYKFGKAQSEHVAIDVNNIVVDSIEELTDICTEGMLIFDAAGRQVQGTTENLHGNYIVISGKTAYKVVLK